MFVLSGSILCDPANPILCATLIRARVVIFNIPLPLTKGYPVSLKVSVSCISYILKGERKVMQCNSSVTFGSVAPYSKTVKFLQNHPNCVVLIYGLDPE